MPLDDPSSRFCQVPQDLEFPRRYLYYALIAGDAPHARIQTQLPDRIDRMARLGHRRWTTPNLRADARQELAMAERLGHVVVGASVQTGDLVDLVAPRREHDDRHVRASAEPARDFDPAQIG